jgi:hypothetical protein
MRTSLTVLTLVFLVLVLGVESAPAQANVRFEQPVLITSAGQSADVTLAGMLFKKIGLTAKTSARATASDLDGVKTLVVVPGFSSKGLGAAGISREQELTRVKELLAAATKQNIPVLLMHIGGKPRRGQQSDDFNTLAAQASKAMMVVKQGDEDGLFSKIAAADKKPIVLVDKIAEVAQPLAAAFR